MTLEQQKKSTSRSKLLLSQVAVPHMVLGQHRLDEEAKEQEIHTDISPGDF